jgi:hypothetical protein
VTVARTFKATATSASTLSISRFNTTKSAAAVLLPLSPPSAGCMSISAPLGASAAAACCCVSASILSSCCCEVNRRASRGCCCSHRSCAAAASCCCSAGSWSAGTDTYAADRHPSAHAAAETTAQGACWGNVKESRLQHTRGSSQQGTTVQPSFLLPDTRQSWQAKRPT